MVRAEGYPWRERPVASREHGVLRGAIPRTVPTEPAYPTGAAMGTAETHARDRLDGAPFDFTDHRSTCLWGGFGEQHGQRHPNARDLLHPSARHRASLRVSGPGASFEAGQSAHQTVKSRTLSPGTWDDDTPPSAISRLRAALIAGELQRAARGRGSNRGPDPR